MTAPGPPSQMLPGEWPFAVSFSHHLLTLHLNSGSQGFTQIGASPKLKGSYGHEEMLYLPLAQTSQAKCPLYQ